MKNIDVWTLKETPQEFYRSSNVACPICGWRYVLPVATVVYKGKAMCFNCYMEIKNLGGNRDGK